MILLALKSDLIHRGIFEDPGFVADDDSFWWSPTGIARGTLLHALAGRHPGQRLAHSSAGKARGLLLPG